MTFLFSEPLKKSSVHRARPGLQLLVPGPSITLGGSTGVCGEPSLGTSFGVVIKGLVGDRKGFSWPVGLAGESGALHWFSGWLVKENWLNGDVWGDWSGWDDCGGDWVRWYAWKLLGNMLGEGGDWHEWRNAEFGDWENASVPQSVGKWYASPQGSVGEVVSGERATGELVDGQKPLLVGEAACWTVEATKSCSLWWLFAGIGWGWSSRLKANLWVREEWWWVKKQ